MKRALYAAMITAAGLSAVVPAPAFAAVFIQVTGAGERPSPSLVSIQQAAVMESAAPQAPLNLVPAAVRCFERESPKACAVRVAAAQRAAEVVAAEDVAPRMSGLATLSLLVPPGGQGAEMSTGDEPQSTAPLMRVSAAQPRVACDPNMTVAQCERLNRKPLEIAPPTSPAPPAVQPPPNPNLVKPPQIIPPVVADPPAVIPPPRTGDGDMIVRPPQTDTDMPVIRPKPNPPVNPRPSH